jgi:DNA polymerase I-like protein with 3'-5' exonuclease and polymerase domains
MKEAIVFIPPTNWVEKEKELQEAVKYLNAKASLISVDIESSGLDPLDDYPIMFSISDGVERFAGMAEHLHYLGIKKFLESDITKTNSNIKIDAHWLANVGIKLGGDWWDTLVTDWLYDENREGKHGLKDCAWDHCGIKMKEFKEVFPKPPGGGKYNAKEAIITTLSDPEGFIRAKQYSGLDAYANVKVLEFHRKKLKDIACFTYEDGSIYSLWDYFLRVEVPFTRVIWNMERRGIKISRGYLKELEVVATKRLAEVEAELVRKVGREINPKSPQQLRELFYKERGKIPTKWTTGGTKGNKEPSTDESRLREWAEKGDDIASIILEHRDISKLKNTYIVGLQEKAKLDDRIHPTFKQAGTVSGRLSCTDPNLQNIPTSGKTFNLRKAFIASLGNVLIGADYSQIELVILAHCSADPSMLEAIRNGKDLHIVACHKIFGYDYNWGKAVKKKEGEVSYANLNFEEKKFMDSRSGIKKTWYGVVYGIGEDKLGSQLTDDFRLTDPDARSKQCPSCGTVYPIDWKDDYCEHVGAWPIKNEWVDTRMYRVGFQNIKPPTKTSGTVEKIKLKVIPRTVSPVEAAIYMKRLLEEFPGVAKYLKNQEDLADKNKYVQSLLGRYRRLPSVDSNVYKDKLKALRQSKNSIQNSAADLLKLCMIEIENDQELKDLKTTMILTVHDELLFETPNNDNIDKAEARIKYLMEKSFDNIAFELLVPIKAEPRHGDSWADTH